MAEPQQRFILGTLNQKLLEKQEKETQIINWECNFLYTMQ